MVGKLGSIQDSWVIKWKPVSSDGTYPGSGTAQVVVAVGFNMTGEGLPAIILPSKLTPNYEWDPLYPNFLKITETVKDRINLWTPNKAINLMATPSPEQGL
ncbi:hypothetical protein C8R44DRAFT_734768 [Mycena epipterygia]|nr:hypothetical protein C8R44DRAFT_734768 [Mycena epipterygia]